MRRSRSRRPALALVLVLCRFLAPAGEASASALGSVVLQNDSVVDFGEAVIQAGFGEGEHGAAWLTASCGGSMTAVRVLWLSLLGGAPSVLAESIEISQAGAFPIPGAPIRELLGPLMQDGGFNEFQLEPPIPVAQGQIYVVDFTFIGGPPLTGPSLVTDANGCQAGRNGIFASPPNAWFSACGFGVSGDFAIRAVVDCQESLFSDGFESGDLSALDEAFP